MNPLDLLKNDYVRGVLILLLGVTIGALFYPTKKVEEKVSQKYEQQISQIKSEFQTYKSVSEEKITSLTSQVTELNTHQKIVYVKVVKPDGTVEIHKTTEKDTQESDSKSSQVTQDKITQIQSEFASKEKTYQETIATLEKSKTTSVNEKRFGIEVGMMSDKDYYAHATMGLWGPLFIGLQGEVKLQNGAEPADNRIGAGIGINF